MPRNDSSLITGMHSGSIAKASKAAEQREARKLAKAESRAHLTPVAELVQAEIKKIQDETKLTLLGLINPSTPKDDVKELIVALNLYDGSIKQLKTRLFNIMRVKETEESDED